MSKMVDELFDSIAVIAETIYDKSPKDITIEGTIIKVVDVTIGKYQISYQDTTFYAYSLDVAITYALNDKVYILVPQGNYSNRKLIQGISKAYSSTEQANRLGYYYVPQSINYADPIESPYGKYTVSNDKGEIGINARSKDDYDWINPDPAGTTGNWAYHYLAATSPNPIPAQPPETWPSKDFPTNFDDDLHINFANDANTFNFIMLKAKFKTNLNQHHSQGAYALQATFATVNPNYDKAQDVLKVFDDEYDAVRAQTDEDYANKMAELRAQISAEVAKYKKESYVTIRLPSYQFVGNPYLMKEYCEQEAYFEFDLGLLKRLEKIELVQAVEDAYFAFTDYHEEIGSTHIDREVDNIICKDIEIRFCDKVDLTGESFYGYLEAPLGTVLKENRTSVYFRAHLLYGGQEVLTEETCRVYWFRRDPTVTLATYAGEERDEHNMVPTDYSGPGWRPISGLPNGSIYHEDFNVLTIPIDGVPWKWDYRCVIVYQDEHITYVDGTISNQDSIYDLEVLKVEDPDVGATLLKVVDHKRENDVRQWFGSWFAQSTGNSYQAISLPYHYGSQNVTEYLSFQYVDFSVACYDPYLVWPPNDMALDELYNQPINQVDMVAALEYTVVSSDAAEMLISWVGDDAFTYDANGMLYDSASSDVHLLTPKLNWINASAKDFSLSIYGPDGALLPTIPDQPHNCDDSMLTNYWIDANYTIHYYLKDFYDVNLKNNSFKIIIRTSSNKVITDYKEISITKAGDSGTQGTGWQALIKVCTYGDPIHRNYEKENYQVRPVVLCRNPDNKDEEGSMRWIEDPYYYKKVDELGTSWLGFKKNAFTCLRPFVYLDGKLVENLDPKLGYFYKVTWDARIPYFNYDEESTQNLRYSSFFRLYHPDRFDMTTGPILFQTPLGAYASGSADKYENDGEELSEIKGSPEDDTMGLLAYTQYPETSVNGGGEETYGSVLVRWYENYYNVADPAIANYNFPMKATVRVYRGEWDSQNQTIITENKTLVATLTSNIGIDVVFEDSEHIPGPPTTNDQFVFNPEYLYTNWPTNVVYDSAGNNPSFPHNKLEFYYSPNVQSTDKSLLVNFIPKILTSRNASIRKQSPSTGDEYYYEPFSHIADAEAYFSAIGFSEDDINDWYTHKNKTRYIRNQIFRLNAYQNGMLNGWDGVSVEINQSDGYIMSPLIGAGYKNPYTNAFTGVLIGCDTNHPKTNAYIESNEQGLGDESSGYKEYLTGLYGYQEGYSSFGILENGTAFFGRRDRGSYIVLDGMNGMIRGGGNVPGIDDPDTKDGTYTPTVGDKMWNSMRLNLVDLTHATNAEWQKISETEKTADDCDWNEDATQTDGVLLGFGGDYYGRESKTSRYTNWTEIKEYVGSKSPFPKHDHESLVRDYLPPWFCAIWKNSYIKLDGQLPYWLIGWKVQPKWNYDNTMWHYYYNYDKMADETERKRRIPMFDWQDASIEQLYTGDYPADVVEAGGYAIDYWNPGKFNRYDMQVFETYAVMEANIGGAVNLYVGDYVVVAEDEKKEGKKTIYKIVKKDATGAISEYFGDYDDYGDQIYNQRSAFGCSRASTTPAIEIGQHLPGLMPGLIPWGHMEEVFANLWIPGDRNFLVTYDGTMWCMNGVFLGNVIGSNILGGRIQGGEIGIGIEALGDGNKMYELEWDPDGLVKDCEWTILSPPKETEYDMNDLPDSDPEDKSRPHMRFYVNPRGELWAYGAHIGGSSTIDLGHFHVINKEDDQGHLIQFGESDFIGPTHFYGNVGIGPNRDVDDYPGTKYEGSNYGNLFQTHGQVGLGTLLPEGRDFRWHEQMNQWMHSKTGQGKEKYNDGLSDAAAQARAGGDPEIQTRMDTLQRTAFFGIDSTIRTEIKKDDGAAFHGHLWPMTFKYKGGNDEDTTLSDPPFTNGLHAYFTTMDIFKSKGWTIKDDNGVYFDWADLATNYFRVGPYGTEGMIHFLRIKWHGENVSAPPNENTCYGYSGWVERDGGRQTYAGRGAIGIRSWKLSPIILQSDGNFRISAKNYGMFYAKDNRTDQRGGTYNATWPAGNDGCYGIMMMLGTAQEAATWPGNSQFWDRHVYNLTTAQGSININVQSGDQEAGKEPATGGNYLPGQFTLQSHTAGMFMHPYNDTYNNGLYIINRKDSGCHMACYEDKDCYCYTGADISECWVDRNYAQLNGVDSITIGCTGTSHSGSWTNKGASPEAAGTSLTGSKEKVGFYGDWATPENQINIYARFA